MAKIIGDLCEYDENHGIFWSGVNGCEYITWKNNKQIFVYAGYHEFPIEIIEYHKRIVTVEDFDDAMLNGDVYSVSVKLEK